MRLSTYECLDESSLVKLRIVATEQSISDVALNAKYICDKKDAKQDLTDLI